MKTRTELCEWMRENAAFGNSCWAVVNGGGISLCTPEDVENFISEIMGLDYADDITLIKKGEEYADFASCMSADEYNSTDCFYRVEHLTGYNQENMDIQIQYWQ